MSIPFPQPHPSTAPSAASIHSNHFSPSPIPNSHHGSYHHHGHPRSRSSSLVPSPTPSQAYLPSLGLAPMEQQGHHYRPRAHSPSSDRHHHQRHHHHRSRSHSQSHSPSGHGSRSVTPAPPLIISQNSEPIGPYVSVPPFQPPYASQPPYGPTLTPADASVPMPEPSPMPTGVQYGSRTPSPQYPPDFGGQFEPPAQTRALYPPDVDGQFEPPVQTRALYPPNVGGQFEPRVQTRALHPVQNNPRSRARKPLVSQELDAAEPNRRDWRIHPHFRQSRCTGKRKALCIGINYVGQSNPLHGCVDDARNIYQFLMDNHHYAHSNIIVLTDDNSNPRSKPTRKNILNAMRWLVEGAHADDALFVHYSGHGGRTRDLDGDEPDGYDEVIFPLDYKTTGIITDDVLHETLIKPLPSGCRLTAVFDSCHSGSILDLNYEFHSNGRLKSSPVAPAFQQARCTPADVVCFSGCKDTQTSADTVQGGVAVGAMSYAFLKVLKRNPQISYIDLLRGVREILRKKYSQKPQLSASHGVDVNRSFTL